MEVFGIGPMELILILIVALMVFGPDKLPQIGAKLGRAMRDMRRATRAISEEINATREAVEKPARELAEPFQEVAGMAKAAGSVAAAARNPGAAIRESVLKELNTPAQPKNQGPEVEATEEHRIAPPEASVTPVISVDTPALAAAQESVVASPTGEETDATLSGPGEPLTQPRVITEPLAAPPSDPAPEQ